MMTSSNGNIFRVYWPFVRGIHRSSVNSPHKGQWLRALIFSLIFAWISGWVNYREAGVLRRHRAHYDVIVIRKSKDYVYGIWVYKALGIWKGYYRVKKSLVSYMKPWTEARNNKYMKYHSKLTYQLSFWNVSRKVDYHPGGKWFIHGPKRRKENQLLSLKHPCWLSLV